MIAFVKYFLELFILSRCDNVEFVDCFIKQRASNLAVVKLDFKDHSFVQKNIADRMTFNSRIAGYGGTIGTVQLLLFSYIKCIQ